jgi:hypothetical protein
MYNWVKVMKIPLEKVSKMVKYKDVVLGNSEKQSAKVESSKIGGGDHDENSDDAKDGSAEDRPSSIEIMAHGAGETRTDEGTEGHERADQLLDENSQVVSARGCRVGDTEYSEETGHGLEPTDEGEVEAILERGSSHQATYQDGLPVLPGASLGEIVLNWGRHYVVPPVVG